jgi:hypothetical protein
MLDRRLGDASWFDGHVDTDIGVGISIQAPNVVRACVQAYDLIWLRISQNGLTLPKLIALVRLNIELDLAIGTFRTVGEYGF